MIHLIDLEMRFGEKTLYHGVNLQFTPGNRYGLTGANGSGKSTLLKLIAGEESPQVGKVQVSDNKRLGWLKQDQFLYDDMSLVEVVLQGRPKFYEAKKNMESLLSDEDFSDEQANRYSEMEETFMREGGYSAESEAARILSGLGLPDAKHDEPMKTLSGGYRLRVLLAQVLFSEPEILLLDEPTNHLDIESIGWLEGELCEYQGVLLVTSHDRGFINKVVTHIADVDFGKVRIFKGNYDKFLNQLAEENKLREATLEKQQQKKDQLQQFVDRFRAKATKARQAGSKARLIEKLEQEMEDNVQLTSFRMAPNLGFNIQRPSSETPLRVLELSKSFGELRVLNKIEFEVQRGEKIAILGPNGIGKSTLLKIIAGNLDADEGDYKWGHNTHVFWLPQNFDDVLSDGEITAVEWINTMRKEGVQTDVRKLLGRCLFTGDDVNKRIKVLSGGEKARLLLAGAMIREPNVLLLDEPSNHMDLEGIDELVRALKVYPGTIMLVSHNRWFVSEVADRILEIRSEKLHMYPGGFDEYLEKHNPDYLKRGKGLPKEKADNAQKVESKLSQEKRKELQRELNRTEKSIYKLEEKLKKIYERMSEEDYYQNTSLEKQQKLQTQQLELQNEIDPLQQKWDELSETLTQD